tara:strand:- start:1879 stop:2466 length:588 start_codon:yes stop_codon:yes gene_type:complete
MFNGIIYNTGKVEIIEKNRNSIFLGIRSNLRLNNKDLGTSISCNGVCLTLTKIKKGLIFFYISKETIKRSNFKSIKVGQIINLEKSLIYGQKISGHFTQGHVDTTGKVKKINLIDKSWDLILEVQNNSILKYLEEKASISVNGVSLTISKVKKNYFHLNIIPHTLKLTNLRKLKVNDLVNLELDIFGKYIYKYTH